MPQATRVVTSRQLYYVDFLMDVLVYTAILNLFDEFVDSVTIDSFTVSLLTAVVMKGLIDAIEFLMDSVKGRFGDKEGTAARAVTITLMWVILFLSKFAILWVVDIIFEDDVDLGGFFQVLVMVLVMMLARRVSVTFWSVWGCRPDLTESTPSEGDESWVAWSSGSA